MVMSQIVLQSPVTVPNKVPINFNGCSIGNATTRITIANETIVNFVQYQSISICCNHNNHCQFVSLSICSYQVAKITDDVMIAKR